MCVLIHPRRDFGSMAGRPSIYRAIAYTAVLRKMKKCCCKLFFLRAHPALSDCDRV